MTTSPNAAPLGRASATAADSIATTASDSSGGGGPSTSTYLPRRAARSVFVAVRGLSYHCQVWGDPGDATAERPPLIMGHGFMDVGASFQFVVDALADLEGAARYIIAPDWRGFGLTLTPPTDTYWFGDYLGDLDALLCAPELGLSEAAPVDLLGHSMGGNIVMHYAGVRPARIRRLVNLEGFGLPRSEANEAPQRLARWLHDLREPKVLRPYDSLAAVAQRLRKTNPRLPEDKALWLASQWSEQKADALWHLRADPAHKGVGALVYRVEEVLACWKRISAPTLWVEAEETELAQWWGKRYPREDFEARLAVVPQLERERLAACGHMLHHDQPEALAARLKRFLDATA
jgi:pimeloyl-ACP methyl ester carboxylesterase